MSLTLQQIVDMADVRVPNAETDATKVDFLNQLQTFLYRKFRLPHEVERMQTVEDQTFYTLPSYLDPSRIVKVVLVDSAGENPQEYSFRRIDQQVDYYNYFTLQTKDEGLIGFYPEPSETGRLIMITFEQGPNTLSSSNMTTVPRFFPDYHMMFVYGLAAELAKIQRDVAVANNYQAEFNELLREARKEINFPTPQGTTNIMPWGWQKSKSRGMAVTEIVVQTPSS